MELDITIIEIINKDNIDKDEIEELVNTKINTSFEEYSKLHMTESEGSVVKKFIPFDAV